MNAKAVLVWEISLFKVINEFAWKNRFQRRHRNGIMAMVVIFKKKIFFRRFLSWV